MCKHSIILLFKLAQINLIQFIHSSVNAYCATPELRSVVYGTVCVDGKQVA